MSTGALIEDRRPRMVVAAKMTTSRWSWKKGLMGKAGSRATDLEVSFQCSSLAVVLLPQDGRSMAPPVKKHAVISDFHLLETGVKIGHYA
jgi:hypothetical protein